MAMTTTTADDIKRVQECLDYIKANPVPKRLAEIDWRRGVEEEARELGILPKLKTRLGCNCPANPYPATYGGDMEDVF